MDAVRCFAREINELSLRLRSEILMDLVLGFTREIDGFNFRVYSGD